MDDADAAAAAALASAALVQVRLQVVTVTLVAAVDLLVAVQAWRWLSAARDERRLKWFKRFGYAVLALEVAHLTLLSLELEDVLDHFVGVAAVPDSFLPIVRDAYIDVAETFASILIGTVVEGCFTYRCYKITKKLWTKCVLVLLAAGTFSLCVTVAVLYSLVSLAGAEKLIVPFEISICAFTWVCFRLNMALTWVFYKELIVDRRSQKDAVTDFAIEALSHQAPLCAITLGASICTSQFTPMGSWVEEVIIQLYCPVCLLSALTALISHDSFVQRTRYHSSIELNSPDQRRGRSRSKLKLRSPSFLRAEMSPASFRDAPPMSPIVGIKIEQTTMCVVEREEDDSYFAFNLGALERARPTQNRSRIRWGAQATPAALPAAPSVVVHLSALDKLEAEQAAEEEDEDDRDKDDESSE